MGLVVWFYPLLLGLVLGVMGLLRKPVGVLRTPPEIFGHKKSPDRSEEICGGNAKHSRQFAKQTEHAARNQSAGVVGSGGQ